METAGKVKWYFKPLAIIIAILAVGPFAIPLVWMSPLIKRSHKILIIIGLVILTLVFIKASAVLYRSLLNNLTEIQKVL